MNTDGSVVSQYQNNKTHTIKNENDSVKLVFDDTTNSSETITMTNSTGVGNESIALTSSLGGFKLTSKANTLSMETAGDVKLTSNTATTDNIVVTNTLGTANDAIKLHAPAAGAGITLEAPNIFLKGEVAMTVATFNTTSAGDMNLTSTNGDITIRSGNKGETGDNLGGAVNIISTLPKGIVLQPSQDGKDYVAASGADPLAPGYTAQAGHKKQVLQFVNGSGLAGPLPKGTTDSVNGVTLLLGADSNETWKTVPDQDTWSISLEGNKTDGNARLSLYYEGKMVTSFTPNLE